jgi:hypothetical protein
MPDVTAWALAQLLRAMIRHQTAGRRQQVARVERKANRIATASRLRAIARQHHRRPASGALGRVRMGRFKRTQHERAGA